MNFMSMSADMPEDYDFGVNKQAGSLYLRISVTESCGLRCRYCKPEGTSKLEAREETLSFEQMLRFVRIVRNVAHLRKIRITGGEPLQRKNLPDFIAMLADECDVPLTLTTNGQRLAVFAGTLREAGLQRVNVSLPSMNPENYDSITQGGDLGETLRGIDAALDSGLTPVKINTVVLRGCNDMEIPQLVKYALERGVEIRFLELMPIGFATKTYRQLFVSGAGIKKRLEQSFHLYSIGRSPGESSQRFIAFDDEGDRCNVGLITPRTAPFCAGCNRLRLTADGRLVGCLADGRAVGNIKTLLRNSSDFEPAVSHAVSKAMGSKRIRCDYINTPAMAKVGG